jgi:hypothetical protein
MENEAVSGTSIACDQINSEQVDSAEASSNRGKKAVHRGMAGENLSRMVERKLCRRTAHEAGMVARFTQRIAPTGVR